VVKVYSQMIFDSRHRSSKACKGDLYKTFNNAFDAR